MLQNVRAQGPRDNAASVGDCLGIMLIRVRTKVATWRVEDVDARTSIAELRARVIKEHNVRPRDSQLFSLDPQGRRVVRETDTLGALGLKHGDMLHFQMSEQDCAAEAGKKIAADGTIVNKSHEEVAKERGFRPGLMSLRSMRMKWTLTDFLALDAQFEFKIKAQKEPMCTKVLMDPSVGQDFQGYMQRLGFSQCRMGFLYGRFDEEKQACVEVLYEPPQEGSAEGFTLLDDPRADKVAALATALQLQKVGWIFAHPPREKGFLFNGSEVTVAAVEQLEAAQGVHDTPFATVRVCLHKDEEGGEDAPPVASIDAFQVSKQCMEMIAEGALSEGQEPGSLEVGQTFTAIVEGRGATKVDNNFFLVNVPIGSLDPRPHPLLHKFPRFNRADELPSQVALRQQLSLEGSAGWTMVDLLADFHLLLFLTDFLDMAEVHVICQSIADRELPLGEGHVALLRAIAGLD